MRKVRFILDKGYPHGEMEEIVTIDDDTDDDEIEEMLHDWVLSRSRFYWEECNVGGK